MLVLVMIFFCLFLSVLVMMIGIVLSKKVLLDKEKGSSFECGFDPFNSSRMSFSIQFFLIGIIFLIFDVEIVLLLPTPLCSSFMGSFFVSVSFILVLLFGLYFEWVQGVLEWLK